MARLVFITPEFSDYAFQISEGKTTVGRAHDNNLIIQHHSVSAHHCEILLHGTEVIVRDGGSTNGIWVDGCRIKGQTALRHGQRVGFGAVEARLELPPPPFESHDTELTAIHSLRRKSEKIAPPLSGVILQPSSSND